MINTKYNLHSKFSALLFIVFSLLLSSCINKNSNTKEGKNKDDFLEIVEELQKDYFKNYWKIENLLVSKLEKDGSEFFIENDCYEILGKFDPTLKEYCQICEQIHFDNQGGLITSYLHLNDMENVRIQFERMKENEMAFIFKEFHKYKDSGKKLEGMYLSIKYDERVEEFANALYAHTHDIESFLTEEWDSLLPPVNRVVLMHHDGPSPYNPNLNESYLAIKSKPLNNSKEVAGAIVHETFHLVNINLLGQKCNFEIDWKMNSYKFLDEGYAQLIQSKFQNTYKQNRKRVDEYSKNLIIENSFEFEGLKTKWVELFSGQEVNIYDLAYSFAYFIEDKYGAEKHKALFLPTKKVSEGSWVTYVENYFEKSMDELIYEWKQELTIY